MIQLRRRHYPTPWGQPSQGDQESIEKISIDDIRGYFERHYHPNGTILGVAGQFEWERLVDLAGELLGDWEPADGMEIVETPQPHRHVHLPFETNQTQIGIAYDSVPYRHPDYFQAWGAVGVLSGGMSARLFTEVRERRGLCYSVYASYHTLLNLGGVFCYAGTSADRAQETLDVTLGELKRLAEGIQPQELDRLKARIKSALIMQQESSFARSGAIARDWYHLGAVRTHGGDRTADRRLDLPEHQRLPGGASAGGLHYRALSVLVRWRCLMEFRSQRLGNGLEIVAECNPDAYSAALGFFVNTGSRDETDEILGVSHFLEHMAFKGSPTRSADDVNREFDEMGADYNACTTEESTIFYAAVLPEQIEARWDCWAIFSGPRSGRRLCDGETGHPGRDPDV